MNKEIFLFYRDALARNLCREYSNELKKNLEDKKKLFEMSLRQQSIPYFATACYQKWGVEIDFLKKEYKDLINGKYRALNCDGVKEYGYELWCDNSQSLNVNSDVLHAMQCNCEMTIPKTKCPIVYISNRSNIKLKGNGYNSIRIYLFDESTVELDNFDEDSNILIYKYSKDCQVNISDGCNSKVKQFDKELRL